MLRLTRWRWVVGNLLDSLWFVPAVCVIAALALSVGLVRWDESDPIVLSHSISAASAGSALAALGSGMLAFTGFVTAVVMMVVQFGTGEFSPRFVSWFRRDRTLKYSLGAFTATFIFALVSTAEVSRGTVNFVPSRTLLAALFLTLLSIAMLLALVNRTSNDLRVAKVFQDIDRYAREVFDAAYPAGRSDAATATAAELARSLEGLTPVQTIRHGNVGSVVMTLDPTRIATFAEKYDSVIELVPAVGDHIPPGGVFLKVYGSSQVPERRLRHMIVFGDERVLDNDPAFAIRLLVDVASKALSPAVNDPTTAVQALDRIENILRYAAPKDLSVGTVTSGDGTPRFVYPTPNWEDLVELGLDEVRAFGAGQYQVARRLRALLEDLIADVPDGRRDALNEQLALLDDAVSSAIPPSQRAHALVPDRQGIGMARRESAKRD